MLNGKYSKGLTMPLVKIPPLPKLIINEPINLELAGDFIEFTKIDFSKLKEKKKKGFLSSFFGK